MTIREGGSLPKLKINASKAVLVIKVNAALKYAIFLLIIPLLFVYSPILMPNSLTFEAAKTMSVKSNFERTQEV